MTINTCTKIESSLIGSLLVAPGGIVDIADIVKPTDFTDSRAMTAYMTILNEYADRSAINAALVSRKIPALTMYLAESTSDAYPPGVVKFAEDISDRAKLRRVRAGLEAAAKSNNADAIISEVMSLCNHEMARGVNPADIKSVLSRVEKIVKENQSQGQVGFSVGFNLHDELYYRYFPGHIWTMGGFTSVGKTAVMVQQICNLLMSGENASVLIVSTEMTEAQLVARIISNFTGVHSLRILSGNYHSAEEAESVVRCSTMLADSPLTIYDSIYELSDIETAFRRAKLQGGVDVGFIDYVQNCRWSEAKSQYQEQAQMAKHFQALAKETRSTVVCLSQVSNDVGKGNTDQLELKGAGEWAAVSDLGVMLRRHPTEKHRLKYEIKKNRHGALGEVELEFKDMYTRLEEKTCSEM